MSLPSLSARLLIQSPPPTSPLPLPLADPDPGGRGRAPSSERRASQSVSECPVPPRSRFPSPSSAMAHRATASVTCTLAQGSSMQTMRTHVTRTDAERNHALTHSLSQSVSALHSPFHSPPAPRCTAVTAAVHPSFSLAFRRFVMPCRHCHHRIWDRRPRPAPRCTRTDTATATVAIRVWSALCSARCGTRRARARLLVANTSTASPAARRWTRRAATRPSESQTRGAASSARRPMESDSVSPAVRARVKGWTTQCTMSPLHHGVKLNPSATVQQRHL